MARLFRFKLHTLLIYVPFIFLISCQAGNSSNTSAKNISYSNKSIADDFGQLESFTLIKTYSANQLRSNFESQICNGYSLESKTQYALCQNNLNYIKSNSSFGNFNESQINQQVSAYKISYTSSGVESEVRILSGAMFLPQNIQNSKGVILFFHGTVINKLSVPSQINGAGSYFGADLSTAFASQGYIVIAPDYVGQGDDADLIHPYILYPQNNVLAGVYLLEASRTLLNRIGLVNLSKQLNLYTTGYSEGGGYTMWSAYMFQNSLSQLLAENHFTFKKSAPISGPYDLVNSQFPMVFSNVSTESANPWKVESAMLTTIAKPALIGYLLSSFGYYTNSSYTDLMRSDFFNLTNYNKAFRTQYTIYSLINDTNESKQPADQNAELAIFFQSKYMINPNNRMPYSQTNNSVEALVTQELESNPKLMAMVSDATKSDWKTNIPLLLIYLNYDSIVTPINSINAYSKISKQSGGSLVTTFNVDNNQLTYNLEGNSEPYDHNVAMMALLLPALNFFNP